MSVSKVDDYQNVVIRIKRRTRYSRGEAIRLNVLEIEFVRADWSSEQMHRIVEILLEPLQKAEKE